MAAAKGLKLILIMPDTMSVERRKIVTALGAQIILTPGREGMRGAIAEAERLKKEYGNAFIPQQFENEANPDIHKKEQRHRKYGMTRTEMLISSYHR